MSHARRSSTEREHEPAGPATAAVARKLSRGHRNVDPRSFCPISDHLCRGEPGHIRSDNGPVVCGVYGRAGLELSSGSEVMVLRCGAARSAHRRTAASSTWRCNARPPATSLFSARRRCGAHSLKEAQIVWSQEHGGATSNATPPTCVDWIGRPASPEVFAPALAASRACLRENSKIRNSNRRSSRWRAGSGGKLSLEFGHSMGASLQPASRPTSQQGLPNSAAWRLAYSECESCLLPNLALTASSQGRTIPSAGRGSTRR